MARAKKTVETATIIPEKAKEAAKPVKVKATKAQKKNEQRGMSISAYERKHVGEEPKWDAERAATFDDVTFEQHLRASLTYYTYFYSVKDLKKVVLAWVQENMKLSKEDLSLYVMSDSELTPMTVCSIVKAASVGMPLREKQKSYIIEKVKAAIDITRKEPSIIAKVEKKAAYAPTIQDRIAEKTAAIVGELENMVDTVYKNQTHATTVYDFITKENLPQAQVGKVRDHFQKQIDEISLLVEGKDKQLNEAYAFLSNKDIKRIGAFYVKMMSDFDSYTAVKKATKKVRLKKVPSKDKLVAKLKYMKESKELKLVSVPPTDILGANIVWVYQTKYRKLGKYVADTPNSLGVKGTSIIGYSEAQSVQKTLRKPDDQLKEFMKTGKVGLRTYLKDIKSVETKLNGRLSDDILILKVE